MVQFDTTATAQDDAYLRADLGDTPGPTGDIYISRDFSGTGIRRSVLSFKIPAQPTGADSFDRLTAVLTYHRTDATAAPLNDIVAAYTIQRLWVENDVTWLSYASTLLWTTPNSGGFAGGGDMVDLVGTLQSTSGYGSSFAIDVGNVKKTWGGNFTILLKATVDNGASTPPTVARKGSRFFGTDGGSTASVVWMPHIVITATDNPPKAITDLFVGPDTSLSESTYTYRQRASLKWSTSSESDFKRYRIRKGINRSNASDHTHLTFVNSRGTTTFIDPTLYTDGSTIYYSIYPEDCRNGSTSTALGATYTNVSNVVSWTKPDGLVGSVSVGSSASTLQEVEVRVRTTTMSNAKKAKIIWGDGGQSYTQNQTSAGGYLYARHRYTKATSGYTIRALIEDVYGFRSSLDSYGTSVTISNLGPVAKIVASPSRQRTASTFSFGFGPTSGANNLGPVVGRLDIIGISTGIPSDSVGLRFGTKSSAAGGIFYAQLWRKENDKYRCIYSDRFSTASANSTIWRNVNWLMKRGDMIGLQLNTMQVAYVPAGLSGDNHGSLLGSGTASFATPGSVISRYRFSSANADAINMSISLAYTCPIIFSAKDSFARGSNRSINRFRWAPNYPGDFSAAYATAGSYTTGATSSFYWAWTTATTQFVAVRVVDDTNASSIDVAGVVIETEATFRIPDDLRDGKKTASEDRHREMTFKTVVSKDYGTLDLGAIGPLTISCSGESYSLFGAASTLSNEWIDISRLTACFQQKKRIYILEPWTAASYAQGYLVDPPVVRDASSPMVKRWNAKVAIVQVG